MHARDARTTDKRSGTAQHLTTPHRPDRPAGPVHVQRMMALQRSVGNQAVQSLMRSEAGQSSDGAVVQRVAEHWPPPLWADEISNLNQGKSPLGPDNKLIKNLIKENAELRSIITQFVASLLDRQAPAQAADTLLREMLKVNPPKRRPLNVPTGPGRRPPSRFPVNTYNTLKEVVNVKRLWETGDQQLYPWPFDGSALKPDYLVSDNEPGAAGTDATAFYDSQTAVGDHVMVAGRETIGEVLSQFASNVGDKVRTYSGKNIRVVVDVADNPAPELHLDGAVEALRGQFTARLSSDGPVDPNLTRVDVIMPDGSVSTVYRQPAQIEEQPELVQVDASSVVSAISADSETPLVDAESQQTQPPATLLSRVRTWFAQIWAAFLRAFGRS